MPRKKISKKQEKLSLESLEDHLIGENTTIDGLKGCMIDALFDDDCDTFSGCIGLLIRKFDYSEITSFTGLSKSTLYRMRTPRANPTLDNIAKVMNFVHHKWETERAA